MAIPATSSEPKRPAHDLLPVAQPREICGYLIDSVLPSSQAGESDFIGPSYLAIGPGGRGIVLKPMDRDCILKNGLHPSIKERLSRVRELALAGVANLYGVERDPAGGASTNPWLIWEYVQGRDLAQYAADPGCTPRKLALAARELVLTIESLHRQGIVHGAIRPSNIIVDAYGSVRLTHVSPLLYSDPGDDVWGVVNTLQELVKKRSDEKTPLGVALNDIVGQDAPPEQTGRETSALRLLASRLAGIIESRDRVELSPEVASAVDEAPRRRSLLAAFVVLVVGAGIALAVWRLLHEPELPISKWLQSARDAMK